MFSYTYAIRWWENFSSKESDFFVKTLLPVTTRKKYMTLMENNHEHNTVLH